MARICKPYPSDVSDEVWSRVAPYLTLMNETARRTSMIAPRSASSPTPRRQATGETVELLYVD